VKAKPDDQDRQIYRGEIEIRGRQASDAINTPASRVEERSDNAIAHYQQGLAFDQLATQPRQRRSGATRFGSVLKSWKRTGHWRRGHPPERCLGTGPGSGPDHRLAASGSGWILARAVAESIASSTPRRMNIFIGRWKRSPTIPPPMCNWATCGWRRASLPKRRKLTSRRSIRIRIRPMRWRRAQRRPGAEATGTWPSRRRRTQLARYPRNAGFHIMLGQLLMEQEKRPDRGGTGVQTSFRFG